MKRITAFVFALALIASPRFIVAAEQGLDLGGFDKESKKIHTEANQTAEQTKKDAEKLKKQAKKEAEQRKKEAEKKKMELKKASKRAQKEAAQKKKEAEGMIKY